MKKKIPSSPKRRRKPQQHRDSAAITAAARKARLDSWSPKTEIGKKVKSKELTDIDLILNSGIKIIEPEISESLLDLKTELLLVGQSKGKFGGGQRRVFRPTQKKTREGNKISFSTICIAGDQDGHVGVGFGKAKETVPAREKATRQAKLNVFKIRRGCGSWECNCGEPHTFPFEVEGKCGSVIVKLMPAPKGKGLCVESEIAKILEFAGIKDCWSKTFGQTKNRINLIKAAEKALKALSTTKVRMIDAKNTSIVDYSIKKKKKDEVLSENTTIDEDFERDMANAESDIESDEDKKETKGKPFGHSAKLNKPVKKKAPIKKKLK